MTNKNQFYLEKYQNFQAFCRENGNGALAGLFQRYSSVSFEHFMIRFIKVAVLPNLAKIDEMVEQKLLELHLTIEDVNPTIVDKFKRYLKLFCTFYD